IVFFNLLHYLEQCVGGDGVEVGSHKPQSLQSVLALCYPRPIYAQASFMSRDDFTILMAIKNKLGQQVEPTESEWNQLYSILVSAQKIKRSFPVWVQQEQAAGLTPDRYWLVRQMQLPRWRASAEARATWQQALRVRSQAP